MRKSFSKQKKIYYVTLSLLLVFALCLIVTGSWFTDTSSVKGNLTKPEIQPTLVYKSGSNYVDFENKSIYWTADSDNKEIYVKFDSANNVKKQICRIYYSITWGTIENGTWTPRTNVPVSSLSLSLVNFDTTSWIKSVNTVDDADTYFNNMLTENGFTDDEDIAFSGMTRQEIIASLASEADNPLTMYYYNSVVNLNSTSVIKVCDGFKFDSTNFTQSDFEGLTAKISFSVEAEAVADRVIGTKGDWVFNKGTNTSCDDRPSDTLISNWKNSI